MPFAAGLVWKDFDLAYCLYRIFCYSNPFLNWFIALNSPVRWIYQCQLSEWISDFIDTHLSWAIALSQLPPCTRGTLSCKSCYSLQCIWNKICANTASHSKDFYKYRRIPDIGVLLLVYRTTPLKCIDSPQLLCLHCQVSLACTQAGKCWNLIW